MTELYATNLIKELTMEDLFYNKNENINNITTGGTYVGTTMIGGFYKSAENGARVEILPDPNTGIVCWNITPSKVFEVVVAGADVGDVIMGLYSTGQGAKWDQSAGTFTVLGGITATTGAIGGFDIGADYIRDVANSFGLASTVTADDDVRFWAGATFSNRAVAPLRITEAGAIVATSATITGAITAGAGSSIGVGYLSGAIGSTNLNLAARGWTQTCVFSATDLDTVAWAVGVLTASDGTSYSIGAGNTGNMAARTYIYLDIAVSTTAYQSTTTATTAVGDGKVLVATAINGAVEPTWEVFGGIGGLNIPGTSIVAASITTSEIAANTIVAGNIAAATITGIQIAASTITSGLISVSQLSAISANIGTITAGTITTDAIIVGTNVITAESRFNALFTKGCFIGSKDDGATETGTVTRSLLRTTMSLSAAGSSLSSVALGTSYGGIGDVIGFNKDIETVFVVEFGSTGTQDVFLGLNDQQWTGATLPDDATSVKRHIGFWVQDATLYASNADNTTQTRTEITGVTITNENTYRFVFDAGTNIKFYVNDVLKATHTTNLPTAGNAYIMIGGDNGGAAPSLELGVYNNYFVIVTI